MQNEQKRYQTAVRGLQLIYCFLAFVILCSVILLFTMDSASLDILKQKDLQPAKRILERILGITDHWVWLPLLRECKWDMLTVSDLCLGRQMINPPFKKETAWFWNRAGFFSDKILAENFLNSSEWVPCMTQKSLPP